LTAVDAVLFRARTSSMLMRTLAEQVAHTLATSGMRTTAEVVTAALHDAAALLPDHVTITRLSIGETCRVMRGSGGGGGGGGGGVSGAMARLRTLLPG